VPKLTKYADRIIAGFCSRASEVLSLGALLVLLSGCVSTRPEILPSRAFDFQKDTFSFANELVWVYEYDKNGKWTTHQREIKPTYYQHCFVVARSARQFFKNARFDPNAAPADETTYRRLIERVLSFNPRKNVPEDQKIVIPGYPDLRTFSQAHEQLLKAHCGGAWQSYVQRGHWRMLFPFSRHHQESTARQILSDLITSPPVVVHLSIFPQLTINHAVVIYGATQDAAQIQFLIYDPNLPTQPTILTYNRSTQSFSFAPNEYFPGGRLDVYEVYHKWNY